MKVVHYIILVIAVVFIIFNAFRVDPSAPLTGESLVAVITIVAGLCVVLLMAILRISKKIENMQKRKP